MHPRNIVATFWGIALIFAFGDSTLYAQNSGVKVNRTVPNVQPPSPNLSFSENPSDAEISKARVFSEPLIRACWESSADENKALAAALVAFSNRTVSDDFSAIEQFIANYPKSPWRISLLVNLGIAQYKAGYFSKAMRTWEDAWAEGRTEPDPKMYNLANRALGELALMSARVGLSRRVEELIAESKWREIRGSTTELLTAAAEGLWLMNNKPEDALRCGPNAVEKLYAAKENSYTLDERIKDAKSTSKGTNLVQVRDLANTVGMKYQMAKRSPGAAIIVPSVAHWKVGHFSALTKKIDDKFVISDPAFGQDIFATQNAIDSEVTSYFLVPSGKLPEGWLPVTEVEGRNIWGKCSTSATDKKNTKECDEQTGGGCGSSCAMARYSIHLAVVSLHIEDTPLFYKPGRGPAINFKLAYSQRDPNPNTNPNYSNFGQKWTFDWLSFITDKPATLSANVDLYCRGGGIETHTGFNASTQSYNPELYSQSRLVRTGTNPISYEKRYTDGSKEIYDIPDGSASSERKVFLHKIIDAAGNVLILSYDSIYRIIAMTDALGQTTTLTYTGSDTKIKSIRDPFGRSASFEYNSNGQLAAITDMIGITSSFEYGTDLKAACIKKLTTPYGETRFDYGDATTDSQLGRTRWIEITDPNGGRERVEYSETKYPSDGLSGGVSSTLVPTGMGIYNGYLWARNTFYWGKKAMAEIGDGPWNYSSAEAYQKAHVYHWLHSTVYEESGGILESEKEPGTNNRIWYNYTGQGTYYLQGSSNNKTKIGRVIGGDTTHSGTTQLIQREYNSFGQKTKEIDPLGRTTVWQYDTNGIDLLNVYQVVSGTQQLLQSYGNYNAQHQPGTVTDAAGQTTTYTYDESGDVLTITRVRNGENEVTTYTYITDPNQAGYGKVATITGPVAGATTSYTYDDFGRVRTVTNPDGYTLTYTYDALNRQIKVEYPDGTIEQTVYTNLDPEWKSDRLGRWTHSVYDALQRVTDLYDPLGRSTHYDYCPCGALEGITDPNGNKTTFVVDLQSRVTSKVFSDNSTITYTYDPTINRLQTVTDAKGQVAHYAYYLDNNLQQTSYTDASGNALNPPTASVSYAYDTSFNRITSMTDGIGTTTYAYNPITSPAALGAGKLSSMSGPLTNSTVNFSYDEYGRVVSQTVAGQTSGVVYDALGRVVSETNPLCSGTGSFSYDYDGVTSRMLHAYYPNGQTEARTYFGNTGDNRLQQIQNLSGTGVISQFGYTYDAVGNILTWTQANSGQSAANQYGLGYDAANQLVSADLTNTGSGAQLRQYGYVYDPAGNRLSERIGGTVTGGTYNGLNQLTGRTGGTGSITLTGTVSQPSLVTVNGSSVQVKANKFSANVPVTAGTNDIPIVATNPNHTDKSTSKIARLVVSGSGSQTYTYDLNGNLVSDGSRSFTWDARNRLTSITYADSSTTTFAYDGQDRRVSIVETSGTLTTTKKLLWVGNSIAEEHDANDTVTKRYYSRGMQVISGTNAVNYFSTADHLGSIRELTNSSGAVQTRYDYDPYGRRTTARVSGTDNTDADFGFTGHYYHAPSGLALTLYRAYDPDAARWLSRDPIMEKGGINLYNYAVSNPVKNIDRYGKCSEGESKIDSATLELFDPAGNTVLPNLPESLKDLAKDAGKSAAGKASSAVKAILEAGEKFTSAASLAGRLGQGSLAGSFFADIKIKYRCCSCGKWGSQKEHEEPLESPYFPDNTTGKMGSLFPIYTSDGAKGFSDSFVDAMVKGAQFVVDDCKK